MCSIFNNSFIFARGRLEQAVVVVRDAVRAADGLVVADAVVVAGVGAVDGFVVGLPRAL